MPKTTPGITQLEKNKWLVQVAANGQRKTARVGGSRRDAEAKRVELLKALRSPTAGTPTLPDFSAPEAMATSDEGRLTLEYFVRHGEWSKHAAIVHRASTASIMEGHARYLCYYLGVVPLADITVQRIRDFITRRFADGPLTFTLKKDGTPYKPIASETSHGAVNKQLALLRAVLRYAHELGLIASVPRVQLLPEDDARPVVPPSDEVLEAIVAKAEEYRHLAPYLPEAIALSVETGLRKAELFHLTWGSIEWDGGGKGRALVRVEEQSRNRVVNGEKWVPKGRRHRAVPLSSHAREVLLALREKVPHGPDDLVLPNVQGTPYVRLQAAQKGAGSDTWRILKEAMGHRVRWHDLRHVFAVRVLQAGVPMATVSQWMGHSDVQLTVKRYGRFAEENVAQWVHIERASRAGKGGAGLVAVG